MKYFSAFSGIGGFELGINKAYESNPKRQHLSEEPEQEERSQGRVGATHLDREVFRPTNGATPLCVGYSEIDKYAIQVYKKHFPEHQPYGDITKIVASELPDFDLFVGGFPCQAFSVAGLRKGFNDTRGTLFFDIARILAEKLPRYVVLENVKGLLSHDEGKTFQTILRILTDLGYFVEWQVLNAKDFGVPQNRERVFIVGHLGGVPERKVFPIKGGNGKDTKSGGQREAEVFPTIRATHYKSGDNQPVIQQLNNPTHSNNRIYGEDGISPTLNTAQGGMRQPFIAPVLTPDRPYKRQNGRRFKEDGDPAFTHTAQDRHGVYDGMRIRRLTPLECERLMGYPDGWTEGLSDTQRYKTLGNGIVSNVVAEVVKKLILP